MSDKILLVDDERDIVDLIAEVLQQDGFRFIQKAYSGSEALRLCEFSICSILFLSSKNDDIDKNLDCHVVAMIVSQNPSAHDKLCFG